MMAKYNGPYEFKPSTQPDGWGGIICEHTGGPLTIGHCVGSVGPLLAAAPTMLAALERIADDLDGLIRGDWDGNDGVMALRDRARNAIERTHA